MAMDCRIFVSFLAQSAPHLDQTTWIALLLAVCATAYVMVRAKRPKKDPLDRSPISTGLAQQRSVERQMSNLLAELTEMSRTISAGLDTRAAKLSALLDEADQKIAALRALNASTRATAIGTDPSQPIEGNEARNDSQRDSRNDSQHDSQHVEVYVLADQGRSVQQIASELGRPRGEIELILALRPRAASSAASSAAGTPVAARD